ncbi:MAG: amino acid adenylation domain-containing protein [Blastocatellia bacterium]
MQAGIKKGFRLSPLQKRLWELQQSEPGFSFRSQCSVIIEGAISIPRLRIAIEKVVNRHEILRTTFESVGGGPLLQFIGEASVSIDVHTDLLGRDAQAQAAGLVQVFNQWSKHPSDLAAGPALRTALYHLEPEKEALALDLSAACGDFITLKNLVEEVAQQYAALPQDAAFASVPQYADIAPWQNELLESRETLPGRQFWYQKNLRNVSNLRLPFELPRAEAAPLQLRSVSFEMGSDVSSRINALAEARRLSVAAYLLACWHVLLRRVTNEPDLMICVALDGRRHDELKKALGLFQRHVPLSVYSREDTSFCSLWQNVHEMTEEAYIWHEYFSWENVNTSDGSAAFPQFSFEFREWPDPLRLSQTKWRFDYAQACTDRFKIKLICASDGSSLSGQLFYDASLYDGQDMRGLCEHFKTLAGNASCNEQSRVGLLEIISDVERARLMEFASGPVEEFPQGCAHEMIEGQAERTPGAIAASFQGQSLIYRELNERANQMAHHLLSLGVNKEDRVALLLDRSLEMVIAILGAMKAGAAYVPLDPSYPPDRLTFQLSNSRASVIITSTVILVEQLSYLPGHCQAQFVLLDAQEEQIAGNDRSNPSIGLSPDNLAYVIYTSGSTGAPKGVEITHRGLCNLAQAQARGFDLCEGKRVLQFASITFDASVSELFMALTSGAAIHLDAQESIMPGSPLINSLEQKRITTVTLPPSVLAALPDAHLPQLDMIISAGERCTADVAERWASGRRFINAYGPSEITVCATFAECTARDSRPLIGKPISNMKVYVLDQQLRLSPPGTIGGIYVGGPGLARGYLGRPDLTAEQFIPDPFSAQPGARMYETGDLARIVSDGALEFVGRYDQQIKLHGYRIELGEIESVLSQHVAVRDCVAVMREDEPGENYLAAYVILHDQSAGADDLQEWLREKLPRYMVPSAIVQLDEFPLTVHGKLDRQALPAPDFSQNYFHDSYVPPRTAREELLVDMWAELLSVERVGIHDNYFDLGGNSLSAVQLISRVNEAFDTDIPLQVLFDNPTVSGLAQNMDVIAGAGLPQAPLIQPVPREGPMPVSFFQQRIWFLDRLEPGSPAYNLPLTLRIRGRLQADALEASLNKIIAHHEVLRTTFGSIDGEPVQIIAPELTLKLASVDLQNLPEDQRPRRVEQMTLEEARFAFDLTRGPLIRAMLLRVGQEENVVLLTVHHIVFDAWSTRLLILEMIALYEGFTTGKDVDLPPLPIQYADYACWQRNWLKGEVLEQQLSYWKNRLAGYSGMLDLPTDRPRPEARSWQGAAEASAIPSELVGELQSFSRRHQVTLFMTLLAAFKILLHHYTGNEDIAIGAPAVNRNRVELEKAMGAFMNTLVLRTRMKSDMTSRELLAQVRETALGAYAHQELPFEMLVEALRPERNLRYTPLFQVMFSHLRTMIDDNPVSGLQVELLFQEPEIVKFDLSFNVTETTKGIWPVISYSTELFEASTIRRMLGHYATVLKAMVSDPGQKLSEIELMQEAERHQALAGWNQTSAAYPELACLHHLFERQVEKTPHNIAVIYGSEKLTYDELNRKANVIAGRLENLGARPGEFVPVLMDNCLELPLSYLGVMKAGAAFVPLAPDWPIERIREIIADAGAKQVLTDHRAWPVHDLFDCEAMLIDADDLTGEASNRSRNHSPDINIYAFYTSGSTGKPKGAINFHRGVVNRLLYMTKRFGCHQEDVLLQASSHVFDSSIWQLLWPLINGARAVIPQAKAVLDPSGIVSLIEREQVTMTGFVPSVFAFIVDYLERHQEARRCFSSLRRLVVGGEAIDAQAIYKFKEFFSNVSVVNSYGPTETSIAVLLYEVPESHTGNIPIGSPIDNAVALILDENRRLVPIGVPGELYIGGECVGGGYINDSAATQAAFIPNPFPELKCPTLYKTGDRARRLPGGDIEFLGRVDNQVKVSGVRIELGEIESVLAQHSAVRQAAVIMREDAGAGKRLIAYVVAREDQACSASGLRGFLKERLPDYMVPSAFLMLEELPLTASGKLDRRSLPLPEESSFRSEAAVAAPTEPVELQLLHIWEEVLKVQPIGIEDDFFELGGHSLLAVRLMEHIEKHFNVELPIAVLFHGPTVSRLARLIREKTTPDSNTPLVAIQPRGSRPPLFFFHPIGGSVFTYIDLARCLGPDQPFYALQAPRLDEISNDGDPYDSLEEMAAYYLEAIRGVQKSGPYYLGGWSMGGILAFESAQQLHRAGEQLGLVAILDTKPPQLASAATPDDKDLFWALARERAVMTGKQMSVGYDNLQQVPADEQLEYLLTHLKKAHFLAPETDLETIHRYLGGFRARIRMLERYAPSWYPGNLTLFRATEFDSELIKAGLLKSTDDGPNYGWDRFAGDVTAHMVPGTHATIGKPPNVQTLAELIRPLVKS